MIWRYHDRKIPLEVYHGVPEGWHADEVVRAHAELGGTFDLSGPEATEPGAPSWMPDRRAWLQYREMLYRVSRGVRAGDLACAELAIRFIELRYIGSYSGFIRSRLSRALKLARLSETQRARLHSHFSDLVKAGDRSNEFRQYLALWRSFISPPELELLVKELRKMSNGDVRADWLLRKMGDVKPE